MLDARQSLLLAGIWRLINPHLFHSILTSELSERNLTHHLMLHALPHDCLLQACHSAGADDTKVIIRFLQRLVCLRVLKVILILIATILVRDLLNGLCRPLAHILVIIALLHGIGRLMYIFLNLL